MLDYPEAEPPEPWAADLEGIQIQPADADHWVAVYTELIRSLESVAIETPEAGGRLAHMRARLAFWKLIAARAGQPAGPA